MLKFVLTEKQKRGNKKLSEIVLPQTPTIGEKFLMIDSKKTMKVLEVITYLWTSGNNLVTQISENAGRPFGEIILGSFDDEEVNYPQLK